MDNALGVTVAVVAAIAVVGFVGALYQAGQPNQTIAPTETPDSSAEPPASLPPQPPVRLDDSASTPAGISAMADANNQFALDFYAQLAGNEQKNIFFSPYSISTALGMTYEGARGQTADEIRSVFHFPADQTVQRSSTAALYNLLNRVGVPYTLSTANALWIEQTFSLLDTYTRTLQPYYGGEVRNLDFIAAPEESRQTINTWVEDHTNGKIKDLLPPGSISQQTRLALTNAVSFKGNWLVAFDKQQTQDAPFRQETGATVQARMMAFANATRFNYTETEEAQILELPYGGNDLSMVILLPKDMKSLEDVLTSDHLAAWKGQLAEQEVKVYLPRFTFEQSLDLGTHLKEMGMPTAFAEGAADFSGIDGRNDLFISGAYHKAFVEVNEEGTEAAAATAVVIGITSLLPPPPVFRADHPFLFLIQERSTGTILFMGRVADPSS